MQVKNLTSDAFIRSKSSSGGFQRECSYKYVKSQLASFIFTCGADELLGCICLVIFQLHILINLWRNNEFDYALDHTVDINPENPLIHRIMGYLNCQVVHHLFPHMPQFRKPAVSRKLVQRLIFVLQIVTIIFILPDHLKFWPFLKKNYYFSGKVKTWTDREECIDKIICYKGYFILYYLFGPYLFVSLFHSYLQTVLQRSWIEVWDHWILWGLEKSLNQPQGSWRTLFKWCWSEEEVRVVTLISAFL